MQACVVGEKHETIATTIAGPLRSEAPQPSKRGGLLSQAAHPGEEGAKLQDALLEVTGQRTVPNVFIGGKHLGGNDDTQKAAASGALAEMLK